MICLDVQIDLLYDLILLKRTREGVRIIPAVVLANKVLAELVAASIELLYPDLVLITEWRS